MFLLLLVALFIFLSLLGSRAMISSSLSTEEGGCCCPSHCSQGRYVSFCSMQLARLQSPQHADSYPFPSATYVFSFVDSRASDSNAGHQSRKADDHEVDSGRVRRGQEGGEESQVISRSSTELAKFRFMLYRVFTAINQDLLTIFIRQPSVTFNSLIRCKLQQT